MTKDEFVAEISKLPGVGKASAEKLYAAGYATRAKLEKATVEELKAAGLTAKVAQAVHDGLKAPAGKKEKKIEVVGETRPRAEKPDTGAKAKKDRAKAAPAEPATRIPEEKEHVARAKPTLTPELAAALKLRNHQHAERIEFHRQEWFRYKRLGDAWRQPRGYHSKQRQGKGSTPKRVKIGFRGVKLARGLHHSGFREVLVATPGQLDGIDPTTHAARIARTVGARKRKALLQAAADKGIRVLNPGGA